MTVENSLRIKVTNRCNRNCAFCHQEGDMHGIMDIGCDETTVNAIKKLCDYLNISTVSITGGEPLLYNNLLLLIKQINGQCNIKKFSLTTNGTISKEFGFWEEMYSNGLYNVNISIPDIIDERYRRHKTIFDNQIMIIKQLNELNIKVNLNIVVHSDYIYTINVIKNIEDCMADLKFKIVLLPNLNDYNHSISVIHEIINHFRLKKQCSKHRKGTSNTVEVYSNNNKVIYIKTTRQDGKPVLLDKLCSNCTKKYICQEGFYGVRLENRNNVLFARLCIHKQTSDVLMPVKQFFNSEIIKELRSIWGVGKDT